MTSFEAAPRQLPTVPAPADAGVSGDARNVRRDLGLHPLAASCLGWNAVGLGTAVVASRLVGPTFDWLTDVPAMTLIGSCTALWIWCARRPADAWRARVADTSMAVICLLLVAFWISPMQYVVAGMGRPLIDPVLAHADGLLGVHTPSLAAWTRARPLLNTYLALAYVSLLPQLLVVGPLVGLRLRDRERLWEYVWHFHLGAAVTLGAWTLFPAASAFQFYGFEPAFNETRFIEHFQQLRAGTLTSLPVSGTEGLISMPSFHVFGALIITWAARASARALIVLVPLNALLTASTVLCGIHYAIDVVGAVVLFGVTLGAWHAVGRPLLYERVASPTAPAPG